jgi:HKD family nuclease
MGGMDHVYAVPGLSVERPLGARLASALVGADRFDAAVAYVKRTGVEIIEAAGLPRATRFVFGTGFALTDPSAVDALQALGAEVRVVIGSEEMSASAFHPKLYLVTRGEDLTVFSGSANLTAGGLQWNVEQYEELRLPLASSEAGKQARRFESLWGVGIRSVRTPRDRCVGLLPAVGPMPSARDTGGTSSKTNARPRGCVRDCAVVVASVSSVGEGIQAGSLIGSVRCWRKHLG